MKVPIVSILIPVYNNAPLLEESINSALSQTWQELEIIIVNDGSTDETNEIANRFRSKNVKVFNQKKKGACSARNKAFTESSGNFIQFLDSDDLLTSNKVEEQMKLFNQFGNNIVTNCKWGRFSKNIELVRWEDQPINKDYDSPLEWLMDSWMGDGMAQTSIWLTPRHLIEKAGPWDESLQINQDGEFFCRVLMHADKIKFSPECGVYYRSGLAGSITQANKQSRSKAESLLRSYKSYERVLSLKDNETIRIALGNNYLNFIYQFSALYPDLTKEAEALFFSLGLQRMWPVGGPSFKKLCKIFGFKGALKLKSILSHFNF